MKREISNKVPQVTLYFWIIKILCTTVGETGADYLNSKMNLGLTGTTLVMGVLLIVVLFFQFRAKSYIPSIYWFAVVLLSIVGTLITDNLTDNFGVALELTTAIFSVCLAIVFIIWYLKEHTLSIHKIDTLRREAFYWLAILFTFALGTAAGDLLAESLALGYLLSAAIFLGTIVIVYLLYKFIHLNAVLAFWIAYILTRPLGASIGDHLSQSPEDGGLGLGTIITSVIFLAAILATVVFLSVSKKDVITTETKITT
ncbi:membrane protein [soil metagenome]